MALITETGTASALSESLASVADATAYHAARGNAAWALLSNDAMEQSLRKATDYMQAVYQSRWQGERVNSTQALDWPRVSVVVNRWAVLSTIVPNVVINACCELALKAAAGELLVDTEQQEIRTKTDVIETEYDKYSPQSPQYLMVVAMLRPYFNNQSSIVHRLVR